MLLFLFLVKKFTRIFNLPIDKIVGGGGILIVRYKQYKEEVVMKYINYEEQNKEREAQGKSKIICPCCGNAEFKHVGKFEMYPIKGMGTKDIFQCAICCNMIEADFCADYVVRYGRNPMHLMTIQSLQCAVNAVVEGFKNGEYDINDISKICGVGQELKDLVNCAGILKIGNDLEEFKKLVKEEKKKLGE